MKRSIGERVFDAINALVLLMIIVICFYPMLYVFNSSISDPDQMLRSRSLMLLPEGFQLEAYKSVFKDTRIYTGYMNTLFYVVVGTAINLLMTSLAAYGLSRSI